jgi:hypothetical protein
MGHYQPLSVSERQGLPSAKSGRSLIAMTGDDEIDMPY